MRKNAHYRPKTLKNGTKSIILAPNGPQIRAELKKRTYIELARLLTPAHPKNHTKNSFFHRHLPPKMRKNAHYPPKMLKNGPKSTKNIPNGPQKRAELKKPTYIELARLLTPAHPKNHPKNSFF
jgi:hypothetical protein